LAFHFYLRRLTLRAGCFRLRCKALVFADKFAQAVVLIARLGACFAHVPVLVATDSCLGNNGLLKPLRQRLDARAQLLSRLRVNAALYARPDATAGKAGRPRKYGARLGSARDLAAALRSQAQTYDLHVYGALRAVVAAEQVVMLKTLRCPVRVVWVYRKTQWVALMTTDLDLTVVQIIEYYTARWKIQIYQPFCLHRTINLGYRRSPWTRHRAVLPSAAVPADARAAAQARRRRPRSATGGVPRAGLGGPATSRCTAS
jgi:hypothetical protein